MIMNCRSDVGAIRKSNQDYCECGSFSDGNAWGIVCDGMGGPAGGNVASTLAVETIKNYILSAYEPGMSKGNIKAVMLNAVYRANDIVYEKANSNQDLGGMGTTAVVIVVIDNRLHVVHVGDSRCYLKTDGHINRVTTDHSYVQNLIDFGQITEEEAKTHPRRNIITRAVGVHETVNCDYFSTEISKGDVILACTDGLTIYADDATIESFVNKYKGEELVNQLIDYSIKLGGSDNVTVLTMY